MTNGPISNVTRLGDFGVRVKARRGDKCGPHTSRAESHGSTTGSPPVSHLNLDGLLLAKMQVLEVRVRWLEILLLATVAFAVGSIIGMVVFGV